MIPIIHRNTENNNKIYTRIKNDNDFIDKFHY